MLNKSFSLKYFKFFMLTKFYFLYCYYFFCIYYEHFACLFLWQLGSSKIKNTVWRKPYLFWQNLCIELNKALCTLLISFFFLLFVRDFCLVCVCVCVERNKERKNNKIRKNKQIFDLSKFKLPICMRYVSEESN